MSRVRGAAPALLALCVVLAGCERGAGETTTVTTTVTAGEQIGQEETPREPHGTIGVRVFGPVAVGMSQRAVRMRFGRPDRVRDVNFGEGEAPQTNWIWDVEGGTVTLKFNATGMLAGYSTTSPQFESAGGVSVGDSIRRAQRRYGDELVPHPQGTGAYVLYEGGAESSTGLTFTLKYGGTEIVEISGGAVVQPAGE
ncbi:MAG TPA: hypothetical protein VEK39_09125 [Solirubrobacterales bacterium]|nr:hypothetical protein [Solirubrobacterales bacterium]